ncbi:formate dehydrogenase subunit gamma [Denitratisoma sp. DHT3]|uniref:formate dehydrogenase subunit gamma n=1 Tax=Denitratisoma sp. DHT3 TaxID=1981880 RepID=UPI00119876DA|nr:formate dehydrogenase subunit gamma [Denitratisoma sp. DHT3]QDX80698.1 formate dehydrogenase subunit gamma [Denitratisoma sp. DHT3]
MTRDPQHPTRYLPRYTAAERANHWLVGICFILLALSGLAFFHPAFFPLAALFGGGVWARILHPLLGVLLALSFLALFLRFRAHNAMTPTDWEWIHQVRSMVATGNDRDMPEQGRNNAGQKLLFWALAACILLLFLSGLPLWRTYFQLPVALVRVAAVVHAAVGALAIGLIIGHVYASIWVKGSNRAMWYGTVTRAWARQHHRGWYREITGK